MSYETTFFCEIKNQREENYLLHEARHVVPILISLKLNLLNRGS